MTGTSNHGPFAVAVGSVLASCWLQVRAAINQKAAMAASGPPCGAGPAPGLWIMGH